MSQVWYSSEKSFPCCSGSVVSEFFWEARMIAYNLGLIYSIQYSLFTSWNTKKLHIAIYMFLHTCITLNSPITYRTQTTILPPLSLFICSVCHSCECMFPSRFYNKCIKASLPNECCIIVICRWACLFSLHNIHNEYPTMHYFGVLSHTVNDSI